MNDVPQTARRSPLPRSGFAIAVALAATVLPTVSEAARPRSVRAELLAIEAKTRALPASPARTRMLRAVRRARANERARPCVAATALRGYLTVASASRPLPRRRLIGLQTAALGVSQRLLIRPAARACGGGHGPAKVGAPTLRLQASDARHVAFTVALPDVMLSAVQGGGRVWTRVAAPGLAAPQSPGQPALPVATFTIAVPDGATVSTKATTSRAYRLDGVQVMPAQPETLDAVAPPNFAKPPFVARTFTQPGPAYRRPFPGNVVSTTLVGEARGLRLATVQVPLARYDGSSRSLTIVRDARIDITFEGSTGFTPVGGAWDRFGTAIAGAAINREAIPRRADLDFRLRPCGSEFLIVTSGATRAAADQLAAARNAGGIATSVLQTGTPALPNTNTAIRDALRARLKSATCIRPSYVLLLGNDELIPTFEIAAATSDLPYATIDDADSLPDVALGRIPGDGLVQVQAVVDKTIAYSSGVGTPSRTALLAAQFQDDDGDGQENRTFIQMSETVRSGLIGSGFGAVRVYADSPASTPQRFVDGTSLPSALLSASAWNGTTADVASAWNASPFLVVHRDHGWSQGWGTPWFTSSDVDALNNAMAAVVMSINCSSGAYDRDDASFATRALVRPTGGAVAVFGDTEDSPSTHNSVQGLGFVDALLPGVLPSEGPAATQRLGDALVHGKLRLNAVYPATTDGNTLFEHRIWHLLGDPTLFMRRGNPRIISVKDIPVLVRRFERPGPVPPEGPLPNYQVVASGLAQLNGQVVSLRRGGVVVGQGLVVNGAVTITALFGDSAPALGELAVVIAPDDGQKPIEVPVSTEPVATQTTVTCPGPVAYGSAALTITGTLAHGPAGAGVAVSFTPIAAAGAPGSARVVTVTVDEQGAFTASLPLTPNDIGVFSVQAQFAGSAGAQPSTSSPCTASVVRAPIN